MKPEMVIADWPAPWPLGLRVTVGAALLSGSRVMERSAMDDILALQEDWQGRPLVIGLCGTFTLQPLGDALGLALATLPSRPLLRFGDLDNIEQSLLDPASTLRSANLHAVVVLWRLEELAPRLCQEAGLSSREERAAMVMAVIERIRALAQGCADQLDAPLFLSTLPSASALGRGQTDLYREHGVAVARHEINRAILELVRVHPRCHVFDFSGWAEQQGSSAWDARMDAFARMPLAVAAQPSFALALRRTLAPLVRPARKVLAVDLDNVLWGGVLGEDGLAGLKVGDDFPGQVYRRIQLACRALKEQGVLLALVSKNNHREVVEAFAALPRMPLALSDFAAVRANWEPKSCNLADIASELGLGLDSLVFVDDSAFEQAQVARALPAVAVLPVSADPLDIFDAIADCPYFDTYHETEADRLRHEDYCLQQQRTALRASSPSLEDFLHSLELRVEIRPLDRPGIARAVQMLARTNQFNLTTRRHGEYEVSRLLADPESLILTLSMRDRFGDQGVVGLAIARTDADRCAAIDSFLLSCRALGRGAEDALWASLVRRLSERNLALLKASYLPTAKNGQCRDFFERLGMDWLPDASGEEGSDSARHYALALPCQPAVPAWLTMEEY